VQQAARDLGYRPHPGARALTGKGTGLIGLIVREINDPFFADLIEVVSNLANEKGYDLVLGNAKRDPEEALALRDKMLDLRFCDGLLLCGDLRESPEDHDFLSKMGRDHRLVSVSRGSKQLVGNTPSVDTDNRRGVFLALDYLTRLGHRRIACTNAGRVGDLWERLEAYREFMQQQVGDWPEEYVQPAENSYAGGYDATKRLLALPVPPTAILAVDDVTAIGALSAVIDTGRTVPGDVSIVGFDDMAVSAYIRPALTTIRHPIEEIGQKAVQVLLSMIQGEFTADSWPHLLVEPELVVRESCGPAERNP